MSKQLNPLPPSSDEEFWGDAERQVSSPVKIALCSEHDLHPARQRGFLHALSLRHALARLHASTRGKDYRLAISHQPVRLFGETSQGHAHGVTVPNKDMGSYCAL